jgi:ribose transport system ATP-binding protein
VISRASAPFLALEGVSKRYGGVTALDGVDFACARSSIHAVLGENGAGKSTLIKIIAGVVQPDEGRLLIGGRPVRFASPIDAAAEGIACIFQELSLMPDLSIADNICITNPPKRFGLIDGGAQRRRATALLARVGCSDLHPLEPVKNLPLSRRQMVEFAKALGRGPKLLILDEATSALATADVQRVHDILRELRGEGVAILYISHRMHEIQALADTCSVFRNGRHIETFAQGSRDDDEIVRLMIGRDLKLVYPPKPARRAEARSALEVRDLTWQQRLSNISFTLGRGEIVGLGGLDGQGQRELLLALFGVLSDQQGETRVNGAQVRIGGPAEAKSATIGMALIPEDRKTEGLMLPMSVRDNLSLAALPWLSPHGIVDLAREARQVDEAVRRLRIKAGDLGQPVASLSGGNQQKVVIGKWLMTGARIVLLNDPTRGIDVGTKQELYELLRGLADAGTAILFYSTDYDELIGMCDRVLIMYDGRIERELVGDAIDERAIVAASLHLPDRRIATTSAAGAP